MHPRCRKLHSTSCVGIQSTVYIKTWNIVYPRTVWSLCLMTSESHARTARGDTKSDWRLLVCVTVLLGQWSRKKKARLCSSCTLIWMGARIRLELSTSLYTIRYWRTSRERELIKRSGNHTPSRLYIPFAWWRINSLVSIHHGCTLSNPFARQTDSYNFPRPEQQK